MVEHQESKIVRNLLIALAGLAAVFAIGTVGYRMLGGEQYSWVDCFYMTFITIASIGYGEIVDVSQYEYGRLFTVFVGIAGIGLLGYVLSTFVTFMLERDLNVSWRKRKMQKKIDQLNDHYIVCGVGLVGSNVANELEMTGRKSVIIDSDMGHIHRYLGNHPEQLYLHGDATDNDVLLAAGIMRAKGVFAVAHDDSANLVISLSAKQLNPNLRVVARCHDLKNAEKTKRAGADEVISPDYTGGLSIVSAMVRPNVMSFLDEMYKTENNFRMEEVSISGHLTGKPLKSLYHGNEDCIVLAAKNGQSWRFNPSAEYILQGNEVLMVMATPAGRSRLKELLREAV